MPIRKKGTREEEERRRKKLELEADPERQKRIKEGTKFIKEREKRASVMAPGGVPTKRQREQAAADVIAREQQLQEESQRKEEQVLAAEQIPRQEEILEREKGLREETITPELPAPKEEIGILGKAYNYIDTLGGVIPDYEAEGIDIKQGTIPVSFGGGAMAIKASKSLLNTQKIATGAKFTKFWNGMRTVLKSKITQKLGKWTGIGYVLMTERSLSSIDAALSQVRESLTLPVQMAAIDQDYRGAFDKITDYEEDILEYESMVKDRENYTPSAVFGGRTLPINQRIKKLRDAIELARDQIAKLEAANVLLTDEELALALENINKVLGDFGEPSKFLGFI